jgi:hypothetical protein
MRFSARHIGSGQWGVWDSGTGGWRETNLSEHEAQQQAGDMSVMHGPYGQRDNADRRQVRPPVPVQTSEWHEAGELDYWVRERGQWWGRVREQDGSFTWHPADRLRKPPGAS